jgi:hypothetical protein
MEPTVCTASVVPAGIVAAFKGETAEQAHVRTIIAMNLSSVISVEVLIVELSVGRYFTA